MGYKYTPWPIETRQNYQTIYNELLRIRAMLETCLAENENDNPFLFEPLLAQVKKRINRIKPLAEEILLYAPEGQGTPPKWFKVTQELVRVFGPNYPNDTSSIYARLDSSELKQQIRSHQFPKIEKLTKAILSAVLQLQEEMKKVPLEESRIVFTQSGFAELVLNDMRKD